MPFAGEPSPDLARARALAPAKLGRRRNAERFEIFCSAVEEKIRMRGPSTRRRLGVLVFSPTEFAVYLDVPARVVLGWISKNLIPWYKLDRHVWLDYDEVIAHMKQVSNTYKKSAGEQTTAD